jgi:hypothetical protein
MKTKIVIAILAVAVLLGAVYGFTIWQVKKADWGPGFQAFQDLSEAAIGTFATGATGSEAIEVTPGTENFLKAPTHGGQGLIEYYREHPGELERDKRYGETYMSAFMIAKPLQDREQKVEGWTASTDLQWAPPSNQTDPWGHAFCVRSSPQRIVVVSSGAQAIGSVDCGALDIPEKDLANMASARLNVQASGALVFVLALEKGRSALKRH